MLKIFSSLVVFFSFVAFSQASPLSIAIVDIENILVNSKVMKHTKKVIEEKTASYQKIITNKEKALGDKRITIDNKIKSLSDKAAKKEMAKFEKEITKFYDEVKNKQENLQNKTLEATKKIQDEVLEIIESIAKKKNIAIVTHKANILYYDNSHPNITDISNEVLKKLDKKLSKLKIKF